MCKVFNAWPKKIQRSYLSWHWRVMQNLKKNWLVVWKMTGILQIFTRAIWSLKIGIMMGSFNPKKEKYDLKIHRGVMCHENEEWCKIWRGIDLLFQYWHEEFDEFWPKYLKVSKIFILMCSFWAKYILFELKKVRRSYLSWNWRGIQNLGRINSLFQNWHKEFDKFWPEGSKVSKIFTNGLLMSKLYTVWAEKVQRSNLSWNWRGIQNLERNRLIVSKLP